MYNKWGNVDEKIIRYHKNISEYNHLQQIYNTWKKESAYLTDNTCWCTMRERSEVTNLLIR